MATSPGLPRMVVQMCHSMAHDLFGTYRPELHYMRGPGPKWREKHRTETFEDMQPAREFAHAHA